MTEVRLREFKPEDAAAVHRWFNDRDVTASLVGARDEFGLDDARDWVARAMEGGSDRKWAITIDGSDAAVGFVGLFGLDRLNGPELGVLIGEPDARGKGAAREAERQACVRAFADHDVHRITAEILSTNEAAKRMVAAVGFRCEGVMRHAVRRGSEAIDCEIWGLLPEDFTGWSPERS
jgi:RimJ/RimL family protein N-acetyltransferase